MSTKQSNRKQNHKSIDPAPKEPEPPKPEPPVNQTFKFEVGCDQNPEFKTKYELIFKSNILYTDSEGFGHSYPSTITGGAAGDGHNNLVTATVDQTF